MADVKSNTPSSNEPKTKVKQSFGDLSSSLGDFFSELIDLKKGMDREGTIISIKNNRRVRGANAWLLMCSIMIASLGLDLDSPAVLIGAMLISPLMSPILGIGLAVGINDRDTLYTSLQHFGVAIAIALITSIFYFMVTPLGVATDQIIARTKPTLLDGLVAIFGGLAGIISATRKDKSNAIPGVAIATALMPPLCVAGFGIANLKIDIFLNSFYLFLLNSFFIALTTYLVVRYLDFPKREYQNEKERIRTTRFITFFSILITIPSAFILYDVASELQETRKVNVFVAKYFNDSNRNCIESKLIEGDTTNQLLVKILGTPIDKDSLPYYNQQLQSWLGSDKKIKIKPFQNNEIPFDDIKKLEDQITGVQGDLAKKLSNTAQLQDEKEKRIEGLLATIDSIKTTVPFKQICREAKTVFPQLEEIGFGKSEVNNLENGGSKDIPLLLIKWSKKKYKKTILPDEQKLQNFIQLRAKLDTVQIVHY